MSTLIELIKQIPDWEQKTYQEIAAALNERPEIDNPEVQTDVPDTPNVSEMLALVQVDDLGAMSPTAAKDVAVVQGVADLIEDGNLIAEHTGLGDEGSATGLIELMVANGLSTGAATRVTARLQKTMPNPVWQAKIRDQSIAAKNGLGIIKPHRVQRELL